MALKPLAKFREGKQVYCEDEKDRYGQQTWKIRYICCIRTQDGKKVYRVKDRPKAQNGKIVEIAGSEWIDENKLEAVDSSSDEDEEFTL